MIPKADLIHGAYYHGHCRNASVARWDAQLDKFRHWRVKFGQSFMEYICHPDDDHVFDVFEPELLLPNGFDLIPLESE